MDISPSCVSLVFEDTLLVVVYLFHIKLSLYEDQALLSCAQLKKRVIPVLRLKLKLCFTKGHFRLFKGNFGHMVFFLPSLIIFKPNTPVTLRTVQGWGPS
jgi:hypothetical protein